VRSSPDKQLKSGRPQKRQQPARTKLKSLTWRNHSHSPRPIQGGLSSFACKWSLEATTFRALPSRLRSSISTSRNRAAIEPDRRILPAHWNGVGAQLHLSPSSAVKFPAMASLSPTAPRWRRLEPERDRGVPRQAWMQPVLRMFNVIVGVGVCVAAAWLNRRATALWALRP